MLIKAVGSESAEVHYHRHEFQQLSGRLTEIEKLLKTSKDSQVPLNDSVKNLVCELTKVSKEIQKLAQERDKTELELKRKQHHFEFLSGMKNNSTSCVTLQEIINDNSQEIHRLKEALQVKEHQLQAIQLEAEVMRKNLSELQSKLKTKHEEVVSLQKEKEELTKAYNYEKEEAKKLVQISYTLTLDREEMKV